MPIAVEAEGHALALGGYHRLTNGTPTANEAPAKPSRNPNEQHRRERVVPDRERGERQQA